MEETKIIYHIDDEETPYLVKLSISPERVTLADFKNVLNRPNYKYFFKSMDDDFGVVKEEIIDDDAHLPCFNGRVVSWLVSAEGSNVSDGASQCTDSVAHSEAKHERVDVAPGLTNRAAPALSHDDTLTETESIISSRQGHHLHKSSRHHSDKYEKYNKYNGLRINGHSKHRSGHGYETASILSSDLETTTFLESDDDASSRVTSTTGRHTNMSSTIERATLDRRRPQRRRRHRLPPMSRTSSFSSITDSTMSLNIITVSLNMDTVNFLGISIVGQSNTGGDGGIYVGSIMKGGAVALDGRIEPGDMILQVNDINFENMSNDEAVRVLREVVQKPGPIKLVVAKCWDPNPKGYFTIPRTEPVRPIDPGAWVAHTAAIRGEGFPPRPPSATTLTSTSSSLASTLPDTEHWHDENVPCTHPSNELVPLEELHLTINTDMPTIVRAMARPDSGLEIRDRMWLKITIPNAFIGADVVDWLNAHVEGFIDRRDARKYASLMLKAGFIRHTVNKITFSEQCYYIFGDLCSALSNMKLDCDTVGPLPPPSAWDMPYSGTYAPHSAAGYSPMPFNFTNEPTVYGYNREESVNSGSGGSSAGSEHICKEPIHDLKSCSSASESELHVPSIPSMPNKNSNNGNGSNGKRSNGSRSRSSGSEQSVPTGSGSGNQPTQQDISGVFGESAWGVEKPRYDGYDLQRGPVFYEAYYPDDSRPKPTEPQQFQRNLRPEMQNWKGGKMMEKIYQTAGESSMNNGNWRTGDLKSQDTVDRYYAHQKESARSNFNAGENNGQKQEDLRFIKNRRFDEEYIKPILSAIENSAREILVKEFEKVSEMEDATGNLKIARSPSPAELENRVSGERKIPMGNSNFPIRSDQPSSFDGSFGSGDWSNWRANDFFTDRNRLNEPESRNPIPCKPQLLPREYHFRPQASNYVMSATITPTREQSFSPGIGSSLQLPESQPLPSNYWPTRNSINQNTAEDRKSSQNTSKSNEVVPGVASIQISEMPRHKTRHHHGEKPRLNKHRRHAPGH